MCISISLCSELVGSMVSMPSGCGAGCSLWRGSWEKSVSVWPGCGRLFPAGIDCPSPAHTSPLLLSHPLPSRLSPDAWSIPVPGESAALRCAALPCSSLLCTAALSDRLFPTQASLCAWLRASHGRGGRVEGGERALISWLNIAHACQRDWPVSDAQSHFCQSTALVLIEWPVHQK